MRNNALCNIVGMRSVKIQMFDGMVRMLGNVRHVLNLHQNLISLRILKANSCYPKIGYSKFVKAHLSP